MKNTDKQETHDYCYGKTVICWRINNAADDAAGSAIASKMTASKKFRSSY